MAWTGYNCKYCGNWGSALYPPQETHFYDPSTSPSPESDLKRNADGSVQCISKLFCDSRKERNKKGGSLV